MSSPLRRAGRLARGDMRLAGTRRMGSTAAAEGEPDCFISNHSVFTTRATWGSMPASLKKHRDNEGEADVIASLPTPHRNSRGVHRRAGVCRFRAGSRAGQDLRVEALALGAAQPSAAEGDRGMERLDREGLE